MGGKKSVKIKSYTTACDWLLATAPLLHLLDTWSNKDHYALGHADLELVVASGAVDLSGHIPQSKIVVETHTIPSSGPFTITVAHAATFITAIGAPPVEYKGAQALDFSGPNPPGLGEYQLAAGVYTFNSGDAGQQVVISYAYSTGSVDDAKFFAVLGVAAEVSVDESFSDYGDPATTRATAGVQRRWLWNSFWDPPEVFEANYGVSTRAPWDYSVSGLVINVDSSLDGSKLIVRVAFRIPTSSWDGNPLSALHFGGQFEPQLGSGSEYVNHLDEQTVYPDCSGVGFDRMDLGAGASYPQHTYEATGYYSLTADGDCNPADLILGMALLGIFFSDSYVGNTTINTLQMLALSLAALGLDDDTPILAPLDDLRAFCEAYGIYMTAPLEEQRQAADWVKEICEVSNTAIVGSGFQIKFVPYCERSEIGNGVRYTAPTAAGPVYEFTDRDYRDKNQPVIISPKRPADQYNVQPLAYIDRDNAYADAQTTGVDQGSVHKFMTRRGQPKNYKTVFNKDTADKLASVLVKKESMQPNQYAWKASATRFALAEAMDLALLTDERTGLSKYPVRITEANEDDKKIVSFKGEDYIYGLNAPQLIRSGSQLGTRVETNHQPGSVNPPIIFMNVPDLNSGQSGVYLTLGLSGASPDWGGCLVWASLDGISYGGSPVATQVGRSIMGKTVGSWASHVDPDTADDLAVDLSESLSTLDSFSVAYEDAFVSLCYLQEAGATPYPYELIAYGLAQLDSLYHYTLKATGAGNKIRRGVYSTPIGAHGDASDFLFMGGPLTRLFVKPEWFGKTVHFKLTSVNSFGNEMESLADVTDYTFDIPAEPVLAQLFLINGFGSVPVGTTLASQTAHNTSAFHPYNKANFPKTFTGVTYIAPSTTEATDSTKMDDSRNPVSPGHVSDVDVHLLYPAAPSIDWGTHDVPWFGPNQGHINVGVNCLDPAYIEAKARDLKRRGFNFIVIDWYGQGTFTDRATLGLQAFLTANPGFGLKYCLCPDKGIANLSQATLTAQIAYIQTQYMSDPNYYEYSGKPVLHFFGIASVLGDSAMSAVKAATTGSSAFWMFQDSGSAGAISKSYCDGVFDWTHNFLTGTNFSDRYNLTAQTAFYTHLASQPTKKGFASVCPGFNGTETYKDGWSRGKELLRDNGACWLARAANANSHHTSQVIAVMVPTWSDYEEGTEIELGIDNDLTIAPSITGTSVDWSVSGGTGDETTVDHYVVWATEDVGISDPAQIGLTPVASVATGLGTFDLSGHLTAGKPYGIYIEAVGKGCIRNKMSSQVSYTA
jgi:hypothetical protein